MTSTTTDAIVLSKSLNRVFTARSGKKYLVLGSFQTDESNLFIYARVFPFTTGVEMNIIVLEGELDGSFIDEFISPVEAIYALDSARYKWWKWRSMPSQAAKMVAGIARCARIAIACNRIKEIRLSMAARACQRIWLARFYNPERSKGMLASMRRFHELAIV
jgi:hypothetical protein